LITAYGLKVIGAMIILIAGWMIAGSLHNAILRAGRRLDARGRHHLQLPGVIARYVTIVFTPGCRAVQFRCRDHQLVAVLGAGRPCRGPGLQRRAQPWASGVMPDYFPALPHRDQIEAAGISGTVRAITLFVTEIDTVDKRPYRVPNG